MSMKSRWKCPIPLWDTRSAENIWRVANEFDFALSLFTELKKERNELGIPVNRLYTKADPDKPNNAIKIIGNPTFGYTKGLRIGIRNSLKEEGSVNLEAWINELRLTGYERTRWRSGFGAC